MCSLCCKNHVLGASLLPGVVDPRPLCSLLGGLFEYVSAANYFGEVVEWCGYGLASWSIQGAAFALFTFCVLLSRARQHHQ